LTTQTTQSHARRKEGDWSKEKKKDGEDGFGGVGARTSQEVTNHQGQGG